MSSQVEIFVPIPRRLAPEQARPVSDFEGGRDLRLVAAILVAGASLWAGLLSLLF